MQLKTTLGTQPKERTVSEGRTLEQALGLLTDALAVVGQDGTILFATETARRLLDGADGIRVREVLLKGAGTGSGPPVDHEVPRVGRPSLSLRAQPIAGSGGQTLVVMYDPDLAVRVDVRRLAQRYGLTPTEARVAAAIAEGETLASFSATRGCTEQTARTHLKRVLSKTGCARQVDLVRLVLCNPLLHERRQHRPPDPGVLMSGDFPNVPNCLRRPAG